MFDLGWSELLLIGIVALIVVGPKDLPGMFRTVGQFVGKAKMMARDFTQAMNDAADDAGVSDIQRSIEKATRPVSTAMDELSKSTSSFTQQTMESGKPGADAEPVKNADAPKSATAETKTTKATTAKAATTKAAKTKAGTSGTKTTKTTKTTAAKTGTARSATAKSGATKKTGTTKAATSGAGKASRAKAKTPSADEDGTSNT